MMVEHDVALAQQERTLKEAGHITTLRGENWDMNKDDIVYVAGHRGLVGAALYRALEAKGYTSLVTRTHAALDLKSRMQYGVFLRPSGRPMYF